MAIATSTALLLAAAGAAAAGHISEGRAEKKQKDFQARVAEQQADSEKRISEEQERDYRKAQSAKLAEMRAAMGKSGTDMGTGTPLLAFGNFAEEAERNALRIRSGGETQSSRLKEQAGFYRSAGKTAQRTGYTRAGASLLSGAGQAYK